jgi:hypothetical protein
MAMNKKILAGVICAVLATGAYFVPGLINQYQESKKDIAFDNSKAGLWEVKSNTSFSIDASLNKEQTTQVCITDKMINDSKAKSLEEKLDVKGLKCLQETKRVSKEIGEFNLSCSGTNPVNNHTVNAKIVGKVDSKPESGGLEISYEVNNGIDAPVKFVIKTQSKRLGECQPKQQPKQQPQNTEQPKQ